MRYIVIPILISLYLFWTIKSIICLKRKNGEEYAFMWLGIHLILIAVGLFIICCKYW